MGRIDELVSAEFAEWEQRGRGWQVWPEPVRPEPPFQEFAGYRLAKSQLEVDDGRRPGLLASLFDSLEERLNPKAAFEQEETVEPEPVASSEPLTAEFVASLPRDLDVSEDDIAAFLDSLHACEEPTCFELLGSHESVTTQFSSSAKDSPALERQLKAFFPKLHFIPAQERLAREWNDNDGRDFVVDFGLAHEFMLPLNTGHAVDPFVCLVAVLNDLKRTELAVFQVLFQGVQNPWPGSIWRSVTDANGKALFVNRLELIAGTKEKVETPLYGVVVRIAVKAEDFDRAAAIVRDMASALRAFTRHEGNRLIPLSDHPYPFEDHAEDVCRRQSRRSGMILNREELLGFVHLPSNAVQSPKLRREMAKTKAAPNIVRKTEGLLLGNNVHAGESVPVRLMPEQRVRHCHIIGASGTGKSTLLYNLIRQDIERGEGIALLDPHGDLVERILSIIPRERVNDVVLVDPSDEEYSVGFNILSAHSELEKSLLASDLVSVFQRLSTSWGDQMGSVLNNAILAFLESKKGGTLADLQRFLIEPAFRNDFLTTVEDSQVLYYWKKAFPQLTGNRSIGPVLTRLGGFLDRKPVRYMVTQKENRLDFAEIMDTGKIFLAKLAQGQIGNENAYLLGSFFVSKFQQLAMSRQAQAATTRRDFWLYIDEFHHFITPSMAQILTGARKYRLGLVLAHQELRQLQRDSEVASAVLGNASTRICFRVGDDDARKLAEGFSFFESRDLQNLETGNAITRVDRSDYDFNLTVSFTSEILEAEAAVRRQEVISASRRKYATPRAEVEARLHQIHPDEEVRMESKPAMPAVAALSPSPPSKPPEPRADLSANEPRIRRPAPAPPSTKPTRVEREAPPPAPKELGRGGRQHKYLQHLISQLAIGLKFEVDVEKEVLDGEGSVDVALRKGSKSFAFEISVTTDVEHELGNLRKCLKAGFNEIAMVCVEPVSLARVREATAEEFSEIERCYVHFCLPDNLPSLLAEFSANSVTNDTISHGRKTKVKYRAVTEDEARKRREVLAQISTQSLKKLKDD